MATSNPTTFSTDVGIQKLKPRAERFEAGDVKNKGLRVRVTPRGTKTFVWYYRDGSKIRRLTLGQYGEADGQLTLAKARRRVTDLRDKLTAGVKPHTSDDADTPKTVQQLADLFYDKRIVPSRKRPDAVKQILDHDILPAIGTRRLNTITTVTLGKIIDDMVSRGAKSHAGKCLAILKQLFNWAAGRGYVEVSPALSLQPDNFGVVTATRQRALDTNEQGEAQADLKEVAALWAALDAAPRISPQVRHGTKLLLLTGVRSGELRLAKWKHIDQDNAEWTIPVENQKLTKKQAQKGKPFVVPLSPMAVELFELLKDAAKGSEWVLPSRRDGQPFTDKALARAITRLFDLKDKDGQSLLTIERFTAHDMRRTLRTHLSRLRVPPHICEKCLNHSLGRLEETYGTHTFLDERRDALEKWANQVDLQVTDRENVVRIGGAA